MINKIAIIKNQILAVIDQINILNSAVNNRTAA